MTVYQAPGDDWVIAVLREHPDGMSRAQLVDRYNNMPPKYEVTTGAHLGPVLQAMRKAGRIWCNSRGRWLSGKGALEAQPEQPKPFDLNRAVKRLLAEVGVDGISHESIVGAVNSALKRARRKKRVSFNDVGGALLRLKNSGVATRDAIGMWYRPTTEVLRKVQQVNKERHLGQRKALALKVMQKTWPSFVSHGNYMRMIDLLAYILSGELQEDLETIK